VAIKRKYLFGGLVFTRKQDVVHHVRQILARYEPGQRLAGEDLAFVVDLLAGHPNADQKIGPGVASIAVQRNDTWKPTLMFVVERVDGTRSDFSFMKCIYRTAPMTDFLAACRTAVLADVMAFKQRCFDRQADASGRVRCELTGQWHDWDQVHVDHAPPHTFRAIVRAFCAQEGLDPTSVEITGFGDGEMLKQFADDRIAQRFRAHHGRLARLRIIGWQANLRLPRGRQAAHVAADVQEAIGDVGQE